MIQMSSKELFNKLREDKPKAESLKSHKLELKMRLIDEQQGICPYSMSQGNTRFPTDMHEFLIRKNEVQKWGEDKKKLIYCPENCVVLDHEIHMMYGQTVWLTEWLIRYKLEQGYELIPFLQSLPFKYPPIGKMELVAEIYNNIRR